MAARDIIAQAHLRVLQDYINTDVLISKPGQRSVLGHRLLHNNGMYQAGRFYFTHKNVAHIEETPTGDEQGTCTLHIVLV